MISRMRVFVCFRVHDFAQRAYHVLKFKVQLNAMDPDFCSFLSGAGLGENALSILADEAVVSMDVFQRLREEHFEKLLPKLAVGDHAILLQLWDTKANYSQAVY